MTKYLNEGIHPSNYVFYDMIWLFTFGGINYMYYDKKGE